MPILLPPKQTAKAVRARKRETVPAIDWLGLWAISLGLCAVVLAGIADVMGDDNIGAAFILIGAAAIIALIVCADGEAQPAGHNHLWRAISAQRSPLLGPTLFYKPGLRPNTQRRDPSGRRHIVT
jgi:drug/metabolite transporter (DMT)-like permease